MGEAIIGGENWYSNAASYWDSIDPTVNGMLGGFEQLTEIDCTASVRFVSEFIAKTGGSLSTTKSPMIDSKLACDCGAGIGRVSKNFLLKVFDKVDLVEQNPKFLEEAKRSYLVECLERVERFVPVGLQDFNPDVGRYDLIWAQWVLGHLTDEHLVDFFIRCKNGLKPGGLIGVKENISVHGLVVDEEDNSFTRTEEMFKDVFTKAGLKVIKQQKQSGFPAALFPVKMFMLQPFSDTQ